MIPEDLQDFLEGREFIYLATCNPDGHPYVVPKFLIKADNEYLYLADFVIGRAFENLKRNPRVSLSVMNLEKLIGYEMNGTAEILDHGQEFDEILRTLRKRQMRFSVERIVEGIHKGKRHENFEVAFPEHFAVIKITVRGVIHISSSASANPKDKKAVSGL